MVDERHKTLLQTPPGSPSVARQRGMAGAGRISTVTADWACQITLSIRFHAEGFSLQANAKTIQGKQHLDRNGQFEHINTQVKDHQGTGDPVISRRDRSGLVEGIAGWKIVIEG